MNSMGTCHDNLLGGNMRPKEPWLAGAKEIEMVNLLCTRSDQAGGNETDRTKGRMEGGEEPVRWREPGTPPGEGKIPRGGTVKSLACAALMWACLLHVHVVFHARKVPWVSGAV